ncbi:hypothetical protein AK830_g4313 [Neonectria ditissima]|uniref:Aconitase X catalytic domain-containing protein n=1 Tax=Neonectria ditissima TaxID=78410 RepID=A0A0P7B6P8_9HYPO|nr:hypothetical protein AK830_g4313 [Neonectria ditissima]
MPSHTSSSKSHGSARILVPGLATGPIIFSDVPLSFMLGVDPESGVVIDNHHPLNGTPLGNTVLAIPCGRGSCSGSGAILELLMAGNAPAALIFQKPEEILTLGVLIARTMFSKSIPVLQVEDAESFRRLATAGSATITDSYLVVTGLDEFQLELSPTEADKVLLTPKDKEILEGLHGPAAKMAMKMIVSYAALQGADTLVDVSQVHIDACIYVGKSSLLIPQRLHAVNGKFAVPATCNSLSVDRLRWRELGADPELSIASSQIGDLYLAMGATQSFTCAPYLLETKPEFGAQIGWAESNAVVFANSVLGARTQKYPDYVDVFIALTGRAPYAGCHQTEGRIPKLRIDVPQLDGWDESVFPLLGYHIGGLLGSEIPLIYGLEMSSPTIADLKAFGAGFATSSSAPMFHIRGVTPEACSFELPKHHPNHFQLETSSLHATWKQLNSATSGPVDVVSLGNPHFALEEFARLAELCRDRRKKGSVEFIITTSQQTYKEALAEGYLEILEQFGARLITDTCWCMIQEPVIPPQARVIMTNSAKYAHYGPGMVRRGFLFGGLAACVEAACAGEHVVCEP